MEADETRLDPATELAVTRIVDQRIREVGVHREDFTELKDALTRLSDSVDQLAQAQGRTEQRVEELARAQGRTEQRVEELAQAQSRTEQRVEELARAQENLAQAQARTEKSLQSLARTVQRLSEDLGVGLEDLGETLLPGFLLREHNIRVERLENRELELDGHSFEIDLLGKGKQAREPVLVLVEVKTRATKSEVGAFDRRLKKIAKLSRERVVGVLFGMRMSREARNLCARRGMIAVSGNQL